MPLARLVPILLASVSPLAAQANRPAAPSAAAATTEPPDPFKGLKYRLVGPYWGGRVSRVAGVAADAATYYAATASGGVWKSTNGGLSWKPIFDDQPISSIGSIAVAPSDPNVVYVGSGEANIRGNVAAGNGIYRSTDAGKTWAHVWKQEGQIGALAVHPRAADVAYAAVLGHAFGPNPERGVYRTRDGGKTWQQVLRVNDSTGASDVALDPSNPGIVFAGFWETRRSPWSLTSGGPGSGLWISKDGGDTWKQLTGSGLPGGIWGKVGVAVAPSDGRRVYALIEADSGGLFRSDDGGDSWTRISASRTVRQRPWYYSTITVHPTKPDEAWFPNVPMVKTIDGGKTLSFVDGIPHGDHHDVWFDPANPKRMIVGNDGGVAVTIDGGETWHGARLPIGQCYHIAADNRTPYHVACALQDLGTAQGPSNSLKWGGIEPGDWHGVGGGEAGHIVSKLDDPDVVFAGEYLGIFTRYDHRTGDARNVAVYPENPSGHGAEDAKYRFQWTAPIAPSPHDPSVVYHAGNVLFRTSDGGATWTPISPDLTRNDKARQKWSGGPITGDNTGVEFYGTIFAVAESPLAKGLIWAGSDDGLVQVTRDGGGTWKNVTAAMPGFPEWGTVSLIEPSPHDAGTAYVVVDAHRLDDMRPHLFKTQDYGASWKRLDGSLAKDVYLHAVREDPAKRGLLYLGTERGVMVSPDDGQTWRSLKLTLPTVAVHDLIVKDGDLVLGTHGRSIWILDDLTPVREWSDAIRAKPLHLFRPRDAIAWRRRGGSRTGPTGENPPAGAVLTFHLKEKPKGEAKLEVLDPSGTVIRTLSSVARPKSGASEYERDPKPELALDAGMNRVSWDLSHDGAKLIKDGKLDSGNPQAGPGALPGTYTLRVSMDGVSESVPLVVTPDPRVRISDEDRAAQLGFGLELREAINRLTDGVHRLRSIREQLIARNAALTSVTEAAGLVSQSKALVTKLDSLENRMHNPTAEVAYDILAMRGGTRLYSRIAPLYNWAIEGDGAPTQGMKEVFADQRRELDGYLADLLGLVETDLAAINGLASRLGVGHVVVPGKSAVP
jgi:photosystem II stability/assembly factor-like uncharacterized protein